MGREGRAGKGRGSERAASSRATVLVPQDLGRGVGTSPLSIRLVQDSRVRYRIVQYSTAHGDSHHVIEPGSETNDR